MSDSDLPQGWSWVPLGELIQPVMTRDPAQEPNIEITYFDIGSIDNELGVVTNPKRVLGSKAPSRARQVVEAGDVLFSTVRPYLRGIAQVPLIENGMASTGFCVLRPENSISAKYLYYLVRSDEFLDGLLPLQRGASYPAVREVAFASGLTAADHRTFGSGTRLFSKSCNRTATVKMTTLLKLITPIIYRHEGKMEGYGLEFWGEDKAEASSVLATAN